MMAIYEFSVNNERLTKMESPQFVKGKVEFSKFQQKSGHRFLLLKERVGKIIKLFLKRRDPIPFFGMN